MRFVDDQRVVLPQAAITMSFSKQNAIRHDLDESVLVGVIIEADFVTNRMGTDRTKFFGQPRGKTSRRDPPRLCATDHAVETAAQLQANFWKLCGFT